MRWFLSLLVAAAALTSGRAANATPGEWRFGAALGSSLSVRHGVGLGARVSAAYEPVTNLSVSLSSGFVLTPLLDTPAREPLRLLSVTPGVVYQLDVVRWIPYLGVSAGYYADLSQSGIHGVLLAPEAGIDYLVSREWRLGLQYRPNWYLGGKVLGGPVHQVLVRIQLGSGW